MIFVWIIIGVAILGVLILSVMYIMGQDEEVAEPLEPDMIKLDKNIWYKHAPYDEYIVQVGPKLYRGDVLWNHYPSGRKCNWSEENYLTEVMQRIEWYEESQIS